MDPYQDTPEPLPPTMRVLVPNRKRVLMRFPLGETRQWRHSRRPPSFIARLLPLGRGYDTAPACFYRICQFAVLQDTLRFRNEIEYFCHRQWPIATLPDPRDESDPERLAFLAGLTRILCASFNARIAMGLHRDVPAYITNWEEQRARPKIWEVPPVWAERTPPLDRQLRIAAHEGDPGLSDHLQEMGILMKEPHYLFT
ncbi:hypothetical protein C8R46DRAFT_909172 [Mycena filopes]|nr:hypothetical protein C8R46DRAFT_909172 [Mycena filopes]